MFQGNVTNVHECNFFLLILNEKLLSYQLLLSIFECLKYFDLFSASTGLFSCYNMDILVVMERAIEDGMDVISLSIVSNHYALPYDMDSISIGKHGILVSCSAGN